jgi:hypothetical protein
MFASLHLACALICLRFLHRAEQREAGYVKPEGAYVLRIAGTSRLRAPRSDPAALSRAPPLGYGGVFSMSARQLHEC